MLTTDGRTHLEGDTTQHDMAARIRVLAILNGERSFGTSDSLYHECHNVLNSFISLPFDLCTS